MPADREEEKKGAPLSRAPLRDLLTVICTRSLICPIHRIILLEAVPIHLVVDSHAVPGGVGGRVITIHSCIPPS